MLWLPGAHAPDILECSTEVCKVHVHATADRSYRHGMWHNKSLQPCGGGHRMPPPRPPSDVASSVRSSFTFTPIKQQPAAHATPLKEPKSTVKKRAKEQELPGSEQSATAVDSAAPVSRDKGWFLLKAAVIGITLAAGVTKVSSPALLHCWTSKLSVSIHSMRKQRGKDMTSCQVSCLFRPMHQQCGNGIPCFLMRLKVLAWQGVASHNAAAGKQCSPSEKHQRQGRQAVKEARPHRTPGYPSSTPVQETYLGADLPHGPLFPSLPAPDPMRGRG